MNSPMDDEREEWLNRQPDVEQATRDLYAGTTDSADILDVYEIANNIMPPDIEEFMKDVADDEKSREDPDWVSKFYDYISGKSDAPPTRE